MSKLNPDVLEMVGAYLKEHGFSGLIVDDCGCTLEDLAPCGEIRNECEAGYKRQCEMGDCKRDSDEGCQLDCDGFNGTNWTIMRIKKGS